MVTVCGKCNSNNFEVRESTISATNYRYNIVSCSDCGMPVGVLEFNHLGNQLQEVLGQLYQLSQKIETTATQNQYSINSKIDALETEISDIRYRLRQGY